MTNIAGRAAASRKGWESRRRRDQAPVSRALRYIRGEGWTVKRLAGGLWSVKQAGDERQFTLSELLVFAGVEPDFGPTGPMWGSAQLDPEDMSVPAILARIRARDAVSREAGDG